MNTNTAEILRKLYEEIKHGDEEHQQWLKDKIEQFIKDNNLEDAN
jgi:bacterioferritin (cytochrome b1)